MKNMPDDELSSEIGKRLLYYNEEPDFEVWGKIVTAFIAEETSGRLRWISWTTDTIAVLIIILLCFSSGQKKNKPIILNSKDLFTQRQFENTLPRSEKDKTTIAFREFFKGLHAKLISDGSLAKEEKFELIIKNHLPKNQFPKLEINQIIKELIFILPNDLDTIRKNNNSNPVIESKNQEMKISASGSNKKTRSITFYGSITPLLSYQKILPFQDDNVLINGFEMKPILSRHRSGINIEAGIQSNISRRLEFYGGLSYYHQSQNLTYSFQSDSELILKHNNDLSYSLTPAIEEKTISYKMRNIGILAGIMYNLKGEQLMHKIGAGLSYQQGLSKSCKENIYVNCQSQYLFYQIFYRNEYYFNNTFRIFIQPSFSHIIFSHEKLDAPFKLKPYRAGLSLGLIFHLQKH